MTHKTLEQMSHEAAVEQMADREQVLDQALASATHGNMDQAFALVEQVTKGMLASRNQLFERMGLFTENNLTKKD